MSASGPGIEEIYLSWPYLPSHLDIKIDTMRCKSVTADHKRDERRVPANAEKHLVGMG